MAHAVCISSSREIGRPLLVYSSRTVEHCTLIGGIMSPIRCASAGRHQKVIHRLYKLHGAVLLAGRTLFDFIPQRASYVCMYCTRPLGPKHGLAWKLGRLCRSNDQAVALLRGDHTSRDIAFPPLATPSLSRISGAAEVRVPVHHRYCPSYDG